MENHTATKMEERDEEAEETLSFCDLPLYNDTSADFSDRSFPSSSFLDDTLFEFSTSDLSDRHHSQSILFFGRSFSTKTEKKTKSRPDSDDWAKRVLGKTAILRRQATAAPANSRWPLLMVGPAKFPAAERKSSRRLVAGVSEKKTKREKRLWGMVKALGCGGGYLAVA